MYFNNDEKKQNNFLSIFFSKGLASAQGLSLKAWREARKQAKENGEEIGMPRPARTPLSRRRPKKQNVKSMIVRRSKRIIQQQRQSSSYKPITNISHKMICKRFSLL